MSTITDLGWEVIANNCATVVIAAEANLEEKVQELSDVIETKCGHRPNTRVEIRSDRILVGYVEDGSDPFDAMRFGRVVVQAD